MPSDDKFDFRILVSAATPEQESELVKNIASEFIRLGIHAVSVIADGEHINYIDGEAYNVTDVLLGESPPEPKEVTSAYVVTHTSTSLN